MTILWVIKYLEENKYHVKEIAWTSSWALIWSLYATWLSFQEIYTICNKQKMKKIITLDLKNWLFKTGWLIEELESVYWNITFDDLDVPLKVIATDFSDWSEVVIDSWPVLDAIRHTIRVPWIISFDNDTETYVDWWLSNNLPVDKVESKKIVAVSSQWIWEYTSHTHTNIKWMEINTTLLTMPWRVAHRALNIVLKNMEDLRVKSYSDKKEIHLIRPNLQDITSYSLNQLDIAIQRWYDEAKKVLW